MANNLKPFDLNDNRGVPIEKSPLELRVEALEQRVAILERELNVASHTLYKRGDVGVPESIRDSNGDVVLGLCKVCGAGEIELEQSRCVGNRWCR